MESVDRSKVSGVWFDGGSDARRGCCGFGVSGGAADAGLKGRETSGDGNVWTDPREDDASSAPYLLIIPCGDERVAK